MARTESPACRAACNFASSFDIEGMVALLSDTLFSLVAFGFDYGGGRVVGVSIWCPGGLLISWIVASVASS